MKYSDKGESKKHEKKESKSKEKIEHKGGLSTQKRLSGKELLKKAMVKSSKKK